MNNAPLGVDSDKKISIFSMTLVKDRDDGFAGSERLRDLIGRVDDMRQSRTKWNLSKIVEG
jgi:hypothetical protein